MLFACTLCKCMYIAVIKCSKDNPTSQCYHGTHYNTIKGCFRRNKTNSGRYNPNSPHWQLPRTGCYWREAHYSLLSSVGWGGNVRLSIQLDPTYLLTGDNLPKLSLDPSDVKLCHLWRERERILIVMEWRERGYMHFIYCLSCLLVSLVVKMETSIIYTLTGSVWSEGKFKPSIPSKETSQ